MQAPSGFRAGLSNYTGNFALHDLQQMRILIKILSLILLVCLM